MILQRRHSIIGMHTPIEYETIHRNQPAAQPSQVSELHQPGQHHSTESGPVRMACGVASRLWVGTRFLPNGNNR